MVETTTATTECIGFEQLIQQLVTTHNREVDELKNHVESLIQENRNYRQQKHEMAIKLSKATEIIRKYRERFMKLQTKLSKKKSKTLDAKLNEQKEKDIKNEEQLEEEINKLIQDDDSTSLFPITNDSPPHLDNMDPIDRDPTTTPATIPTTANTTTNSSPLINDDNKEANSQPKKKRKSADLWDEFETVTKSNCLPGKKMEEQEVIEIEDSQEQHPSTTKTRKRRSKEKKVQEEQEDSEFSVVDIGAVEVDTPEESVVQEKTFKYVDVVRKKCERQLIPGTECDHCQKFYDAVDGEGIFDRKKFVHDHSRHRHRFEAPHTPPHYWDLSFPDTETQEA